MLVSHISSIELDAFNVTSYLVDITLQDLAFRGSDLEGSIIVGRAARRRGRTGSDATSHGLGSSVGRSSKSSKSECSLHDCKANEVDDGQSSKVRLSQVRSGRATRVAISRREGETLNREWRT